MNTIRIFIIYQVVLTILAFIINLSQTTKYKSNNEKLYFIDIKKLSSNQIYKLKKRTIKYGKKLDPKKNNNNSSAIKLVYYYISTDVINFYLNDEILNKVRTELNQIVYFAPNGEKYRIFSRLYANENDWINFHYDSNLTQGLRYTMVIPLFYSKNNTSRFVIKNKDEDININIPLGKAVIYNGSKIYHSITKQTKNEERFVIIIPLYTNYKQNLIDVRRQTIRNLTFKLLSL